MKFYSSLYVLRILQYIIINVNCKNLLQQVPIAYFIQEHILSIYDILL